VRHHLHQYVERVSERVVTEQLLGDAVVRFLYSRVREHAPRLFRMLTGPGATELLAMLQFDLPLTPRLLGSHGFLTPAHLRLDECLDAPETLRTPRQLFERRIRYWDCRPTSGRPDAVVSPADARVLTGSLAPGAALWIKQKLFTVPELLGSTRPAWATIFGAGSYAIFRLTPDKYHYTHTPVAGVVRDVYDVPGAYHTCNPAALLELAAPWAKNRRSVTVFDTDVGGGTGVGRVAMLEVAALMIGDIVQCYSHERYDAPAPLRPGMTVRRGVPKSLFRPGSSTVILLFEPHRIRFTDDLVRHGARSDVESYFTLLLARPSVETDVLVRSEIAVARPGFGDTEERA
jgi:phosphatidylserine decarboxylase